MFSVWCVGAYVHAQYCIIFTHCSRTYVSIERTARQFYLTTLFGAKYYLGIVLARNGSRFVCFFTFSDQLIHICDDVIDRLTMAI
jgi:hypothetical protein